MKMKKTHNLRACCGCNTPFRACTQIKEERKEESVLFSQRKELLRIHRLIIMGDAEVDMAAQG